MEFSIRDYIREIKNAVNVRLDMLEALINSKNVDKVEVLNAKIQELEIKMNDLINSKKEDLPTIIGMPNFDLLNHTIEYNDNNNTKQFNLNISKIEEQISDIQEAQEQEQEQVEEEQVEEEVEEEQVEEEVEEEQVEEEQVEEEQVEEEVEEEQVEEEALTEFEYKGIVLYRDTENKVYQIDDEGELVDIPIGVWNEAKQKVVAIKN